ncbi:hypothetical protein [Streptomyces sp. NBC_00467]|uniref:hypothetical protein n=1 Tax=Streptomyces sp. NBC_00467 TaxID=2975752 RepID=UPI002E16E5B2
MTPPREAGMACLLAGVLLLSGCASSSRSDDDYRHKAANTAETAASAVNTARIGVQAGGEGRVTGPYLSILLGEAEKDLLAAQGTFESRQPPSPEADAVRDRLGDVLDDAADALAAVRIAVRRGQVRELPDVGRDLPDLAEQLEGLEKELTS